MNSRKTGGKSTSKAAPRRVASKATSRAPSKTSGPRGKAASSNRVNALRKTIDKGVRREAVKSGNRVKRKVR